LTVEQKNSLLDKVTTAAKQMRAGDIAISAIRAFALDPHGIERTAAPSMLASSLDVTIDTANEAIVELLSKDLLIDNGGNPSRLEANLKKLGLNSQEIAILKARRTVFVNHGSPHSDAAMESLSQFFERTDGTIFVSLEATPPTIFKALKTRAGSGRRTVFLMPKKRDLPERRQRHYDEIRRRWTSFLLEEAMVVRENTELRVTEIAFEDLYTSAISEEIARFDVHFLDSGTTRDGEILEVKCGTSLYKSVYGRYAEALTRSCPLWRVWPGKAAWFWSKRLMAPIALLTLGLMLASTTGPYAAVTSTVALGVLANLLSKHLGLDNWYRQAPFGK
jgi:hypothetical protein